MFQCVKQSTFSPWSKIAQSSLWTERRKLSHQDEWLLPLGRWLTCDAGPEAQTSSKARDYKEQTAALFPPALILSGITTLLGPCHFSGIGQFEGSMSFCLYKMLMTQKVSLIHWSQWRGVTKLSCLLWASVDGWIRGGRRGICEGNTFPSHRHPPTSEKVKQLLLSSSLTSFPHELILHFLRSCPKM